MALEQIADKVVETDLLVVGGGIGGCCAAAKAAEHGLKVTLVEKSKTDRSGSASQGIDHYGGAFQRGITPKEWEEIFDKIGLERFSRGSDPSRLYRVYANALWGLEELEKLGVTMRWDDGDIRSIVAHHPGPAMRVHWINVKPEMAAAVRKRGVNVLERTMVIDLLTNNNAVVGATAVDTRTGEFTLIKAKATVMATAACSRIFNPETPMPWKYKFRYHWCPVSVSGDGWAMAYRAGAEIANMEMSERGYRFRDDLVMSYGNVGNEGVLSKLLTWDGEECMMRDLDKLEKQGKDPFYQSLTHLPDDFQKRVEVAFVDERMVSLKIAEERGFNTRTHWYELMDARPNQLNVPPGINVDANFKTSLKGLYAIGDCVAGSHDVATASTSGFLVGDSIHTFISEADEPVIDETRVKSLKETALTPLSAKGETEPMEMESAIRYIVNRYAGIYRAEGKLREGLRRLASLKREFLPRLMARNPHYLMRSLEVRNLLDIAEVHMLACMERKETRDNYTRLDYPQQDPALDGLYLYQRLVNGKLVSEFRKLEPMAFADDHQEER